MANRDAEAARRAGVTVDTQTIFERPGSDSSRILSEAEAVIRGAADHAYVLGDAKAILPHIPDGCVTTWVTSPPYFRLKDYGSRHGIGSEESYRDYLGSLHGIWKEAYRSSSTSASLWIVVDFFKDRGETRLLPFDVARTAQTAGWKMQDMFIWNKHKALPWSRPGELRNGFEHILLMVRGKAFKFRVDRVRDSIDLKSWWVRYPERYNPRGKVPDGVWDFEIPTKGSWGNLGLRHPCPFPMPLVERIVQLSSDARDLVVDPFAGSGSAIAQACAMGRRAIGIELERRYKADFEKLLREALRTKRASTSSTLGVGALEQRIWRLRQLKFAREIFRLCRTIPGTPRILLASVEDGGKSSTSVGRKLAIKILVDKGRDTMRLERTIRRLTTRPPLSKYQLAPAVNVVDSEWEWPAPKLWLYGNGRFWAYKSEVRNWKELKTIVGRNLTQKSAWPILVSRIKIDLSAVPES